MKIIKYLHLIFLISLFPNYGQTIEGLGIKFGYTSSNSYMYIRNRASDHHDRRSSMNFGIFSDFRIIKNSFISSEIYYSGKGFEFTHDESNVEIDCLSLGLLYKHKFELAQLIPYVAAGVRYDQFLKITTNNDPNSSNDIPFDWERIFKNNAYGLSGIVGLEYEIISKIFFLIEMKYNYDLSNSFEGHHYLTKIKNNSFDLSFGVKL